MSKLPKKYLFALIILALVPISLIAYQFYYREEVPKEISFDRQKNSISFDATVLGVTDQELQVLVTKEGSSKIEKISTVGAKFRLLMFDPNTFSVTSNKKIDPSEIKAGDRIRFSEKVEEFPQSLEDLGTIDIYRSESK